MTAVASIPTITVKRRIATAPQQLFDAWLNPAVGGAAPGAVFDRRAVAYP